jgi:hypothetical protein
MSLTLGLTGMDPATEAALKSAFEDANARFHAQWRLVAEAEADHVVVDMDSMYGPMSWLRLHAAGKHVIGLTSAARTQTDFRLGRPFDSDQVGRLLVDLARQEDVDLEAGPAPAAPPSPAPEPAAAAIQDPAPPTPAVVSPPVHVEAEAAAAPAPAEEPVPVPEEVVAAALDVGAVTPAVEPAPEAAPPPPVAPPRDPVLADWLVPGALSRRVRYRRASGPTLLIDPGNQAWHGPTPLKPIAPYFEGTVEATDFEPVDDTAWARDSAAAGPAQSLTRLRWLGGLVSGRGTLLPGNDPDGRYMLNKWPQTEREYPKHFRIATAMMKGPARLPEIAAASGMPESDVADFINANLATGYAEFVPEPPAVPVEPPKSGGLLGRLRNR